MSMRGRISTEGSRARLPALAARRASARVAEALKAAAPAHLPRASGHDFARVNVLGQTESCLRRATPSRCPFGGACHTCPRRLQRKLEMGEPEDEYEREADRVAGRVMRAGAPGGSAPTEAPPIVHEVLGSPGQALEAGTRARMEARLGHDFGAVRVHTDGKAAASARAVQARAYTVGRDVVFGEGQAGDERLLAHELAHVVQSGGRSAVVRRQELKYLAQVKGEEAAPYLQAFARALDAIEATVKDVKGSEGQELRADVAHLRALYKAGRVTCWQTSGAFAYASWHDLSGEIRLHIYFGGRATSETTLVHEGIHALLASRYPRLSQLYGKALEAGGTTHAKLGVTLLQYKAWTEYWAYRRQREYLNARITDPAIRLDPHAEALQERAVQRAIAAVKAATGKDFDPSTWTPPATYRKQESPPKRPAARP